MARPRLALMLLVLLGAGCRDARDLFSLGAALDREYPDTHVSVRLTDGLLLTVTMANPLLARAPCDSQATLAMHVATFVRDHYAGFDSLQTISVAFEAHRSSASAPPGPRTPLPYRFGRAAVAAGLGTADSTSAVASCKTWKELQN
jgi:hypothetical protein